MAGTGATVCGGATGAADGRPEVALDTNHLVVQDVVDAGRERHGVERIEQVRWAVLEPSGGISVVPYGPG